MATLHISGLETAPRNLSCHPDLFVSFMVCSKRKEIHAALLPG